MKTTELFVEQTLTGFLVLTAAAAPFLSLDIVQKLPEKAKGGLDISSVAGAIGAAYLLGVVFDRFADTLLERVNRWNRLLFAIDLLKDHKGFSEEDPFPEDRLQIEVIHHGHEAWAWMDYLRSRIRLARAMAVFVPALTLSLALTVGFSDRWGFVRVGFALVVAAYAAAFLATQVLERSRRRLPKTYHLHSAEDCRRAEASMIATHEPAFWLVAFLLVLAVGFFAFANRESRTITAAILGAGTVLSAISGWAWWRTTESFMQYLSDFRKWAKGKRPGGKDDDDE
jgi:hypothetical protein